MKGMFNRRFNKGVGISTSRVTVQQVPVKAVGVLQGSDESYGGVNDIF